MMNKDDFFDGGHSVDLYLTSQLINSMTDYVSILDLNNNFVSANQKQIEIMGYQSLNEVLGNTYYHFKGIESKSVETFTNQDNKVLHKNESLRYLSYQKYADAEWRLLLGDKTAILDHSNKVTGIWSQAKDITNDKLIDFSRFMFEESKKYSSKSVKTGFNYIISPANNFGNFSKKEMVIIFYFLRGKTASEISKIISRAEKTVHFHLDAIKVKSNVRSKSELIEKLIYEGFMNIIPEEILVS